MTDLDARVAALKVCPFCGRDPKLLDLAGWEVQCDCGVNMCLESPEQAAVIKAWNQRAELQKPALHEPVTEEETDNAIDTFLVAGNMSVSMRRTLESFLQGRAKPALQANAATEGPIGYVCPARIRELKAGRALSISLVAESEALLGNDPGYLQDVPVYLHPPVPARAQEEITDAERLNWIEARTHDSSHSIQVRLVRDPAVNAGINRIELRTACGSGMYERATEGHDLRAAIDAAIRASKGEKT